MLLTGGKSSEALRSPTSTTLAHRPRFLASGRVRKQPRDEPAVSARAVDLAVSVRSGYIAKNIHGWCTDG